MVTTCPRCRRSLSSVSAEGGPRFCMYCGQKLNSSSAPAESRTHTYTPTPTDAPSGVSDTEEPPSPEPAPEEVGGYKLVKLLGAGGMGAVYEAEKPGGGARVALKLLSTRLAANPSSVERFRQEGRLASQLAHPRCVFVLSADTDNGRPYIVMELMPGRTLKDLVEERGPLSPREAVARTLDVIDGLAEAHRVGMIHRDVKPSNCFLTADDRVKIGDFGLSKSLASGRGAALTQTGAFLGTVLFASPEQIRGEPLDYSSDVYSVAATLYFLLCGSAPFHHENATAAIARAISEPPPRVRKKRKDVPAQLDRVVAKGLERDRSRRWQTLDDFREALVSLLPERQRPARPRVLATAYFLDILFTTVVLLTPWEMLQRAVGSLRVSTAGVHIDFVGWALVVAYFTVCEGIFGATLGKAMLGLRVSRVGQTDPPGVPRALVRASVFALIWMWILDGSRLAVLLVASGEKAVGGGFSLFTLGTGLAALLVQMRKPWGFRGLHDFASGCQVTQRPLPARKLRLAIHQPTPLETLLPPPKEPLPDSVGGFVVRGRLSADSNSEQVWLAQDLALGRTVLLWLRPWGSVEMPPDPNRPTRLRRLGRGSVAWGDGAFDWTAFAAPLGGPLAEAIRPGGPLPWADSRYLLEQLAEEFRAGEADGTLPPRLALDHIWVEPNGRVQVLDFPLCDARYRKGTPLAVLREAASLVIEGYPRAANGPVSAPLPAHAMPVLNRLFTGEPALADFQRELAETHAHRPEVTPAMRAAHVGLQAVGLAAPLALLYGLTFALSVMFAFMADMQADYATRAAAALADPVERAKLAQTGDRARDRELDAALANPRTPVRVNDLAARTRAEADSRREALLLPQRRMFEEIVRGRRALEEPGEPKARPGAGQPDSAEAVRGIVLWAGAPGKGDRAGDPWGPADWGAFFVGFVVVPFGLMMMAAVLLAGVFRGGPSMLLAGIAIVRGDGRPAFRLQCALRAVLVWLPVFALLFAAALVQTYAPQLAYLAAALWVLALALLPVFAVVALRYPARPPQDRLTGTHLVPV
jgi:hypothetical protein